MSAQPGTGPACSAFLRPRQALGWLRADLAANAELAAGDDAGK
jgi:hypothetical protein